MARKASSRSRSQPERSYDDVPDTGDVVTVEDGPDDGFAADLDVDAPPKRATRKTAKKKSTKSTKATKKKTTRRKKAKPEPDEVPDEIADGPEPDGELDADADDEKPAREKKPARKRRSSRSDESNGNGEVDDATAESDDSDASSEEESTEESSASDEPVANNGRSRSSSGSGNESSEEGGGRRRRRRRRRRRGGRGGGDGEQQSQQPNRKRSSRSQNEEEITGSYEGVLELHPKNYGFLRDQSKDYTSQDNDPFVSSSLIDKYGLREGVLVKGDVGPGSRNQGPRLKTVETIDGRTPEEYAEIKAFDDLTPINPFEKITLERGSSPITMRVLDMLTPIGKGQRALIVAPPRSGKTMLMQDIAESVSQNHPEIHLMVLLIDERPEEVTEMRRSVNGEVIASSMDRDVESHVRVSQLLVERAKRMAESGQHVLILLDSITRLGRAFNKWVGNSGRTGTGGLDVRALDIPRKMFGTARRFDEGGSLTVVGTALIETGSRADDAIFQEFKGTGNMELVLSRDLADRRIFPAMDIEKSGTRREEKLFDAETLESITMLRRSLVSLSAVEAMEQLIRTLQKFPTNAEFLQRVRSVL